MEQANTKVVKMESKKRELDSTANKAVGRRLVSFIGDVKQELRKIEWTNKGELKSYTKIVLAGTFIFALFIYLVDLVVRGTLGLFSFLFQFFIG